ncbi:MAG: B12-binding domain-containing radical SAM protein [Deltaproteobacteria bacterium]|jgi:radical SAM superfamily enzyme YgiQ (UPF0313 family)|nr:B12-binding domain-containing radical SAM protein [Deltaproteobacteria bacterium]MBW2530706.1 B12-binding domain-containing radical SAM protein [Deltaproteobacteria bacterium]
MRIHFVFPRWTRLLESRPELKEEIAGYDLGSFRMASLGIPTAAASLPEGVEISFVDDNVEPVDFDVEADLIALSFFTPQAESAFRIADRFRERGRLVIAGGIHPTTMPEETAGHADAVMVGEVEGLWETILADLAAGSLRPRYQKTALGHELDLPQPRRSIFHRSSYLRTGVVQVSRGCPRGCPYCVIPTCYGRPIRLRPIDEVVEDIRDLPYPTYFLADENVLFADAKNVAYTEQLLRALGDGGEQRHFFFATYPHMLRDADRGLLRRFAAARCRQIYLIFGLEAPLREEFAAPGILERIAELRDAGISVMASITLGHDGDDQRTGELVETFADRADFNLAEFIITTPYPGTRQFEQMARSGRLLTREWSRYNGADVVFRPQHLTEQELLDLYLALWRRFYRQIDQREMLRRYIRGFSSSILERPSG